MQDVLLPNVCILAFSNGERHLMCNVVWYDATIKR